MHVEISIVHYDESDVMVALGKEVGIELTTHCPDDDKTHGLFNTHGYAGAIDTDEVVKTLVSKYLKVQLNYPQNSIMVIESYGASKFDGMWTQAPDCVS